MPVAGCTAYAKKNATPIGMAANAESQDTVRTGTTGSSRWPRPRQFLPKRRQAARGQGQTRVASASFPPWGTSSTAGSLLLGASDESVTTMLRSVQLAWAGLPRPTPPRVDRASRRPPPGFRLEPAGCARKTRCPGGARSMKKTQFPGSGNEGCQVFGPARTRWRPRYNALTIQT